jgi:hypothetical protein
VTFQFESRRRSLWLICLTGFALVALNAARSPPQIDTLMLSADGDDQMRLVQVRDWLAGQGWFDTRQHRVLPPDSISMHWSRYIDLGLAAILTVASQVLAPEAAERATVILWPCLLACLMVVVHARGAGRLMGPAAALGALAVFFSWGKLGGEFVAPRIDHHNVQILCGTVLFYLALRAARQRLHGALAGAVTAISLAVGLEMLPYLATIWGLMALRHAFDDPGSGDWLLGFAGSLALAAPLLLAGQTTPSGWATPWCDVLAPPVMALGAVGIGATLTPVLAARWLRGPLPRILALVAVTSLGLWLAFPMLGQCLAGPYSDVPPEVRKIIENNVIEALSAATLAGFDPELLGRVLGPPAILAFVALVPARRLWPELDRLQRLTLIQASVVLAVGFGFALHQIRATNLMTPAVPLMGGFLFYAFTRLSRTSTLRIPAVILLLLALPATVEQGAIRLFRPVSVNSGGQSAAVASHDCRSAAAMAEIASLPRSTIFSTLNLGTTILAYTPHSVASVGYHRSPQAFWNGIGAFETPETLRQALLGSKADHVLLCVGGRLERSLPQLQRLLTGDLPSWLSDATEGRKAVRLFRVNLSELAADG